MRHSLIWATSGPARNLRTGANGGARVTAQQSDGRVEALGAGTKDPVVHRADQLCRRAEPHAADTPCPAHLAEARRQLWAVQR